MNFIVTHLLFYHGVTNSSGSRIVFAIGLVNSISGSSPGLAFARTITFALTWARSSKILFCLVLEYPRTIS